VIADEKTNLSAAQTPPYPELFIGLVAAVGTDHNQITALLDEVLKTLGYQTHLIRLASLLHGFPRYKKLVSEPVDDYIEQHQKAGDDFRSVTNRRDALAVLGIGAVQDERSRRNGNKHKIIPRCAYIIRSLKTPEEVETLRGIYGDAFFLIGSSAPYHSRRQYLASKIAASRHNFQSEQFLARAESLIQRDQEEVGESFGQKLKKTFHLADAFVDTSDAKRLRKSLERILELLFGNTFHTPTREEYAMFHATAAALRSSELGRQVGAAIVTDAGDIIAVGTNEVPKAGGGLYWEGDDPDHREFVHGEDTSDAHKRALLEDLLDRMNKDRWLDHGKATIEISKLAGAALDSKLSPNISGAQITSLIEFGRAVHAEMAAITDAARRGVSVEGATMYVTTFPCHLCARHIVAAGIVRVKYVEPYTKSLAAQLYPDSIAVDYAEKRETQVSFDPFVGIAPRKYLALFTSWTAN